MKLSLKKIAQSKKILYLCSAKVKTERYAQ